MDTKEIELLQKKNAELVLALQKIASGLGTIGNPIDPVATAMKALSDIGSDARPASINAENTDTARLDFVLSRSAVIDSINIAQVGKHHQLRRGQIDYDCVPLSGSDMAFSSTRETIDAAMIMAGILTD